MTVHWQRLDACAVRQVRDPCCAVTALVSGDIGHNAPAASAHE